MSEIVVVMGFPASGKSTIAKKFVADGYKLFNRDSIGGKLSALPALIKVAHDEGERNFVADNTYPTIKTRAGLIELGKQLGIPVRCIWLATSIEDAQFNAVMRQVQRYGHMPTPEKLKELAKKDPNMFPPAVLFQYRKHFEKPTVEEGFDSVEKMKFERIMDPNIYKNKALFLDYDGTLRETKGEGVYPVETNQIEVLDGRKEIIEKYRAEGYLIFGVSNQSGVHSQKLTLEKAQELFEHTNKLLDVDIEFHFCPHRPMIACYCRKPMPGFGVELVEKHKLNPAECIMVGDMKSDETFAKRCGFQYREANDFFGGSGS